MTHLKKLMIKNSIMVLNPYCYEGTWVFDDDKTGLVREAFVAGVPEIFETMFDLFGIPLKEAKKGFILTFAAIPFPGYQLAMHKSGEEADGTWYTTDYVITQDGTVPLMLEHHGWLCPALFKYFATAPAKLYIKVTRKK